MKKCRITVMRMARYEDLMVQYENPISHACDMEVGQVFIANGWERPEGFCPSAWDTLSPFVLALSHAYPLFSLAPSLLTQVGASFSSPPAGAVG